MKIIGYQNCMKVGKLNPQTVGPELCSQKCIPHSNIQRYRSCAAFSQHRENLLDRFSNRFTDENVGVAEVELKVCKRQLARKNALCEKSAQQ